MTESVVQSPQLLPWHAPAVEQLRAAWQAQRLSHAILIGGPEGLGKGRFASWLARAVLCERRELLEGCGECASCLLYAAGSHPDLLWIAPEEDKQQISIDQIRACSERLAKTSYRQGSYKVAIVEPAHQMTPSAANSLLKTLEEPGAESLIILVTSRPSALLATVRSRCQKVAIHRPNAGSATQWLTEQTGKPVLPQMLEFAGGAPLRALMYAERFAELDGQMRDSLSNLLTGQVDVTQVAGDWADESLSERLNWLDLWLMSLARGALAGTDDLITFPERGAYLPSLSRALNITGVYSMVDRARALKAQLLRTALQRELAVESWLIALMQVLDAAEPKHRANA
jgi:DNA polymerase-3 subunit delta'